MIYIITNNPEKFELNPIYKIGTKEMLFDWAKNVNEVPLDVESFGFDPYTKKLLSIQIGDFNNQFLIDCIGMDLSWLKSFLENKILIGHNLKFDLKFLYHIGIYPTKIWDTFVMEKVVYCGLPQIRASLDEVTKRYLSITLDKSIRKNISKEGLTPRVIGYAANDVKYLQLIKAEQIKLLQNQDLMKAAELENEFTPALAYIEYCGFKLDVDKWRTKMEKDQANLKVLKEALNAWVFENDKKKYIQTQLDMFQEPGVKINWASPAQMVKFFEDLGIDCTTKVGGKVKKSVEESVINKYVKTHQIVKMYLDYKKAEKLTSTYGQNFIDNINAVTGRIHTNFKQVLDTGRTASGGKDTDTGLNLINFQNIPHDAETRACFVAEEGNTLIVADYSGQEAVLLANLSMDEGLLEFYDKGLADTHSFVAAKIYPELEGLSAEEISTKHKDKRQSAKACNFSLAYGGNGSTIAGHLNIPVEEGDKIYNAYFEAFPGLRSYFDRIKKSGLNTGYILISPRTGRKSYLYYFDAYSRLRKKMTKAYWERYREIKELGTEESLAMRKEVKDMFYYQGEMERKGLNFPTQGQGAEMTKIATTYLYQWILKNNLFGIVKICNTVHDELVPEPPLNLSDTVSVVIKKCMEKAASFYCTRVPVTVSPEKTLFWKK